MTSYLGYLDVPVRTAITKLLQDPLLLQAAVVQPVVEVDEVVAASADQRNRDGQDLADLVVAEQQVGGCWRRRRG